MPNSEFSFRAPITGYEIRKSADGSEKYVITGMASNTNIDLTGERMAPSAINAMAKSVQAHPVAINNEHSTDWDADFGRLTKAWSEDNNLMIEAELDPDNHRTNTLIKALKKGKQLGFSIGGRVLDSAWETVEGFANPVLTYKDIDIFHVAVTGHPAVPETWVNIIAKSVTDGKARSMPSNTKKAAANWKVGAAKNLPVIDEAWDGQEAKDSIFSWAGWPDNPDAAKAKQGFLVYDAANDDLKGSYKLPFAKVVGGELKAVKEGLNNAASRLPQTDIPETAQTAARTVIDGYEAEEKTTKNVEEVVETIVEEVKELVSDQPTDAPVATPTDETPAAPAATDDAPAATPAVAAPVADETPAPAAAPEATPDTAQPTDAPAPAETPAAAEEVANPAPTGDETAPVVETTAAPEVEAPASADTAPAQVATDTSEETTKSAIFGDFTEPGIAADAIDGLSCTLCCYIFNTMLDDEQSADQQKANVAAALAEFSRLVTLVTNQLIDSEAQEDIAEAQKAFQAKSAEVVSKALTEKDANIEELKKALELKDADIETAHKALDKANEDLKKANEEKAKLEARKALVFGKYDEGTLGNKQASADEEAYAKQFATFALKGSN